MYLEATPSPQSQSSLKVPFAAQGSSHRGHPAPSLVGGAGAVRVHSPQLSALFSRSLHGAVSTVHGAAAAGGAGGSQ